MAAIQAANDRSTTREITAYSDGTTRVVSRTLLRIFAYKYVFIAKRILPEYYESRDPEKKKLS